MDFDLTVAQRKRYDETLAAARERLGAGRADQGSHLSRADWAHLAAIGLPGLCLPPEHGGGGLGALDTALCLEAFGRGCPDTGLAFAAAAHLLACAVPVRDFATEPVRGRLLAGLADGSLIAGNAMTEDEAGSDVGRLAVTARFEGGVESALAGESEGGVESELAGQSEGGSGRGEDEDGESGERDAASGGVYVLNGEKSFVSNGPVADVFVTYAVTDPAAGFLGLSAFAVPRELPGITVGEPFRKTGLDGCPASRVRFEDCRVPAEYLLGPEGHGAAVFQHSMGWERGCLFAIYLGQMERQLEQCVARARSRRQFGRPIGDFQAVSHKIADMRLRSESARLLLYRACWLLDQDRDHVEAVALAKVAVSEAAVANALAAVQIFGAAGYLVEAGIEQQLRDAVPAGIFSGTTEIQRELIAKEAGL